MTLNKTQAGGDSSAVIYMIPHQVLNAKTRTYKHLQQYRQISERPFAQPVYSSLAFVQNILIIRITKTHNQVPIIVTELDRSKKQLPFLTP